MNIKPVAAMAMLFTVCMLSACGNAPGSGTQINASENQTHQYKDVKQKRNTSTIGCDVSSRWDSTLPETAPQVEWSYQKQTLWPYPTSSELGPYHSDSDGYRRCYAHSPSGALLAAANIAAMMTDPALMTDRDSVTKFFGRGPEYETIREKLKSETLSVNANSGIRSELYGFRMLEASATKAIIDLGYQASADGRNLNLSIVYNLVWDDGDWKLQSEQTMPVSSSVLSSFVHYTPWREN